MSNNNQYNKRKKSPLYVWGTILVLILGFLGIKVPDVVTNYFDVPKTETATQISADDSGKHQPFESGEPTFTKEELIYSDKGWIEYGELDNLKRPTQANALINKKMIGTGSKADANIRPPGFISGLSPHGHSRGHLIGNQFGGSGTDERNLVTLYHYPVNTPYMTDYETMIRQAVDKGETVRYRVIPLYEGDTLMPSAVQLEAKSANKNGTISFNVIIPNKQEEES